MRAGGIFVCMLAAFFWLAATAAPEATILDEINQLRKNPSVYARKLEGYLNWFDGRVLRPPGEQPLETTEGVAAVREAIQALRRAPSAPPLSAHDPLASHARKVADTQGVGGNIGHSRITSQQMRQWRLRGWAQNLTYGPADPRRVVIEQLIDDGVPDRGHRRNLLDPRFNRAGIACAPHRVYGQLCVVNLGAE